MISNKKIALVARWRYATLTYSILLYSTMLFSVNLRAQVIEEVLPDWMPEEDYDPCQQVPTFDYLAATGLCEALGGLEPSPNGIIAPGTVTNYPGTTVVSDKNFLVQGHWTIVANDNLSFVNCKFKFAAGAQLTVRRVNTINMTFDGCKFFSCDMMWAGIRLQDQYTVLDVNSDYVFNFTNCHIEDAVVALGIRNPNYLRYNISGCILNNNYVGVDASNIQGTVQAMILSFINNSVGTTSNLRPNTTPKLSFHPLAYAGVHIRGLNVFQIGGTGSSNQFFRMTNGIVCRNSVVGISANEFRTLWVNGILAEFSQLSVKNNNIFTGRPASFNPATDPVIPLMAAGVRCISSNAEINGNTFTIPLFAGVHSSNNTHGETIRVKANALNGTYDYIDNFLLPPVVFFWKGFVIERPTGSPSKNSDTHLEISENIIDVSVLRGYDGILVGGSNISDDNMKIADNNVTINALNVNVINGIGISTLNAAYSDMIGNTVFLEGKKATDSNFGIWTFMGEETLVRIESNHVDGGPNMNANEPDDPFASQCSIHCDNDNLLPTISTVLLCENTVNNSKRGLHFSAGKNFEVRENKMFSHTNGLEIGPPIAVLPFGKQDGRGNQWLGTYGTAAINRHVTTNGIGLSTEQCRFWIPESDQLPFSPPNNLIIPDPSLEPDPDKRWVKYFPEGEEDYCTPIERPSIAESNIDEQVAQGAFDILLTPVGLWDSRRALYRKLLEQPALAATSNILQNFKITYQNTSVASYATAEVTLKNAARISEAQQEQRDELVQKIAQKQQVVKTIWDALGGNLEMATTVQKALIQNAHVDISIDYAQLIVNDQLRSNQILTVLSNAQILVDALAANNPQEQAQKDMYNLEIKKAKGLMLDEDDYVVALAVAQATEEVLGKSSRTALHFLAPCDQVPLLAEAHDHDHEPRSIPQTTQKELGNQISVTPNPAHDRLQINFYQPFTGRVEMVNVAGQVVQSYNLSNQINFVAQFVLAPGIYQVRTIDRSINEVNNVRIIIH